MKFILLQSVLFGFFFGATGVSYGTELSVACASNFTAPMEKLASEFKTETHHKLVLSFGASGTLFAQLKNGAPFGVFLSADQSFPQKALDEGLAVQDSIFTYALGKLVLWSPIAGIVDEKGEILKTGVFRHLAIGNPELAPYGKAAKQAMLKLGLWDSLEARLVMGENITQTFEFVSSGNAEIGFVAFSQTQAEGSQWIVPQDLYSPIKQDAVVLKTAKNNAVAQAFVKFLKSEKAKKIITSFGYTSP